MSISIVILAAGSSSRMGRSKQLLLVENAPMLRNAVTNALASKADNCCVVLGSNEAEHREVIKDLKAQIIVNPEWKLGMGSSLKTGLKFIINKSNAEAILIMLSDQPAITTVHLNRIIDTYRTSHSPIVAAEYAGVPGVPALINSSFYSDILGLEDKSGAKTILLSHPAQTHLISMPEASIDLDTQEDYYRFNSKLL